MITLEDLVSKDQTGKAMHYLIDSYSPDLRRVLVIRNNFRIPILELSITGFFDVVRKIPYRRDNPPVEVIGRPGLIAANSKLGIKKKKKAVLISAWMREKGIPYRLIASSKKRNGKFHHVFPQILVSGKWKNFDATYNYYRPFEQKIVTNAEVI